MFTIQKGEETKRKEGVHDKSLLWHIIKPSSRHATSILAKILHNKKREKKLSQVTKVFGTDISPSHDLDHTDHRALWSPRRSPRFIAINTSWVRGKTNVHNRDDDMGNTHTRPLLWVEVTFLRRLILLAWQQKKHSAGWQKAWALHIIPYVQCKRCICESVQVKSSRRVKYSK